MNPRPLFLAALVLAGMAVATPVVRQAPAATSAQQADDVSAPTPAPTSVWVTQWGGFNHIETIRAVSADSVWAVGSNMVHFDGWRWIARDRRDYPTHLQALDVRLDGTGWAAGVSEEVIPIQDGNPGAPVPVPGYTIADIAVVDGDEAWAVASPIRGGRATILRYRDGRWAPAWEAPEGMKLSAIWMASPGDGWAVGSTAVHFDGQAWTEWAPPIPIYLDRVEGTAPGDVWASGGEWSLALAEPFFRPGRRVLLHFDGSGWRVDRDEAKAKVEALALRRGGGFAISIEGDVFALRDGRSVLLDVAVPLINRGFWGHWVTSATFVPGTDDVLMGTYHGWVYRLRGAGTAVVAEAAPFHDAGAFTSVAMFGERLGWALGRRAMAYDGADWHEMPDASELHQAVDGAAIPGVDAWAVGKGGLVLRYRDGSWERVPFESGAGVGIDADLHHVALPEPGRVWVLGAPLPLPASTKDAQSVVLTRDDAGGWREVWRGPGAPVDLDAAGGQTLVATGKGIWRFDGTAWSKVRETPGTAVGIGPTGELWTSDRSGIFAFDGQAWVPKAWLPGQSSEIAAFHVGEKAMWAVNLWGGFVAANEGEGWRVVRGDPDINGVAGQTFGLRDIATIPLANGRTGIWAVGEPDTIIHATEEEVLALPAIHVPPTDEPSPTTDWRDWFPIVAYFPRLDNSPPHASAACRSAAGAPVIDIERWAYTSAEFHAAGGPVPDPKLRGLAMMTAAELAARHGVDLAGAEVAGRIVSADMCVWWAVYEGRFDCKCDRAPGATPAAADFAWTRMELALFAEDGRVIYDAFAGKATPEPATPVATQRVPPTVEMPPTAEVTRRAGGGW